MSKLTETQGSNIKTQKEISAGHSGLEDAIAADSSICFIDGPRSRLIYRGYSINDLAYQSTFEEIVYLFFYKKLPTQTELKTFLQTLAEQRNLPQKVLDWMSGIPKDSHPMTVLRTMVSALSFFDQDSENSSLDSQIKKTICLIAQMPTLAAAWDRIRRGKKVVSPKKNLSHAENFLYMLHEKEPDPLFSKALDLYLVMLADHELNASTFACRVTASTLSDYYSAITSAIGALKGPLHGGANEQVIKMLFEIGELNKVDSYLQKAFAEKKKVMGFGHRVYKVRDPRSPLLKEMAEKVCQKTGNEKLFKMSERIEEIVTETKKLPSNVDFYSATVLYCIGIPIDLFTPIFAISRISGWSAHYLEQLSDNRLLRPRANYTGAMDLHYPSLQER